jgi:hypothetical protein
LKNKNNPKYAKLYIQEINIFNQLTMIDLEDDNTENSENICLRIFDWPQPLKSRPFQPHPQLLKPPPLQPQPQLLKQPQLQPQLLRLQMLRAQQKKYEPGMYVTTEIIRDAYLLEVDDTFSKLPGVVDFPRGTPLNITKIKMHKNQVLGVGKKGELDLYIILEAQGKVFATRQLQKRQKDAAKDSVKEIKSKSTTNENPSFSEAFGDFSVRRNKFFNQSDRKQNSAKSKDNSTADDSEKTESSGSINWKLVGSICGIICGILLIVLVGIKVVSDYSKTKRNQVEKTSSDYYDALRENEKLYIRADNKPSNNASNAKNSKIEDQKKDNKTDECCVCYDDSSEKKRGSLICCFGYKICENCLMDWTKKKDNTCPICQEKMPICTKGCGRFQWINENNEKEVVGQKRICWNCDFIKCETCKELLHKAKEHNCPKCWYCQKTKSKNITGLVCQTCLDPQVNGLNRFNK